ncbi:MAG TPA: C39 family peptidase [Candidatus Elarobacter sp.]|nr:C39 family peptidase [Candidatus Elarobacter sp.]
MLTLVEQPARETVLALRRANRAVVSWNTTAPDGEIRVRVHRSDGTTSDALPYARWAPHERRSFSASSGDVRVEVDVIASGEPFDALTVTTSVDLDAVAATVPDGAPVVDASADAPAVRVPLLSQFFAPFLGERGWCSATATAMLLQAHGVDCDVTEAVRGVADAAYGGTGNWSFNVAFAGSRGLRAAVAYLRGVEHAGAFVRAGLPVALSIGWKDGELPGAPLEQSAGHLLVLRGLDGDDAVVNDPAHPEVETRYPRADLDRVFRAHGGTAYLIAPRERTAELVALANGGAAPAR